MYNKPPFFNQLKWPETTKVLEGENPHWTIMTKLNSFIVAVICQVVSLINEGKIKKTYNEFAFDLNELLHDQ